MQQYTLPYKYEFQSSESGLTALGGLPLYLDLAHAAKLRESLDRHLGIRRDSQGWTDSQIVMSLILLNLAGGEHVEDLEHLEADAGLCRVVRRVEHHGLPRPERRELERRHRRQRSRTFPSPSAVFRYLPRFHAPEQEGLRVEGKAFIPSPNEHLLGMAAVNKDLLSFCQTNNPVSTATLDMDATLVASHKREAYHGYKGFKAYQPLNTWWAEQELVVHSEFRDGNVPAGFEQLRVFKEALDCLPEGVERVRLRSDTAGYQHELLKYCEQGDHQRFGRIEFTIGCDVTQEFKRAVAQVPEEQWHHERCGKSEEAHAVMKSDLAGGTLPSGDFGANAAWWWAMILSLNLNSLFKSLALGSEWQPKRLKAIRFQLINLPGRVLERARNLWIRISAKNPLRDLVQQIRRKIGALCPAPS